MRLASESAEEEETRLSKRQSRDRARRAAQSSQATKNCGGSETAEARERTARESAEEKDTPLSSETLLHKMSLAKFNIELGLHSMCMSALLRTSYSMCMYLR